MPHKDPEARRAYREANREKFAARAKAWREANPEKFAAWQKAYREANSEKIAARDEAYREANPGKIAAKDKAYREANPGKIAARQKAYCADLGDGYVRGMLTQRSRITPKDIPQGRVEVKRLQLLIKRTCDENRK